MTTTGLHSPKRCFLSTCLSQNQYKLWTLDHVHSRKVTGLISVGGGQLISGSVDGSLVISKAQGRILGVSDELSFGEVGGVSAVANLDEGSWLHGTMDGRVFAWKRRDDSFSMMWSLSPEPQYRRAMNLRELRISSICVSEKFIFVGQPRRFSVFDKMGCVEEVFNTGLEGRIRVILPLSAERLCAASGSHLVFWTKGEDKMLLSTEQEVSGSSGKRPPIISSLFSLPQSGEKIVYALSNGLVRLYDIAAQTTVHEWGGHEGAVMSSTACARSLFATGGKDRTIRLFDSATKDPVMVFNGHRGPVSALLYSPGDIRLFSSAFIARRGLEHRASLSSGASAQSQRGHFRSFSQRTSDVGSVAVRSLLATSPSPPPDMDEEDSGRGADIICRDIRFLK